VQRIDTLPRDLRQYTGIGDDGKWTHGMILDRVIALPDNGVKVDYAFTWGLFKSGQRTTLCDVLEGLAADGNDF